ncbi:GntR family transcriptional repressor for pyruvate dehydrogenase complex [Desulfitobacterium sp. LBE]|uniref:FadR/GntR family transcriptional regulator n=1 Tax=Desulfitobacterium sp. LBE TaxID=884086 RepID=UPI001198F7DD|nr:FadR/GntR family transcriptional regulator [Desulfitobacterium sp. LBE]TWH57140.1 GntR family transcriptional repressor for pyruvate dehydrogenase complex [Desulfitobacterium sp. LBE]
MQPNLLIKKKKLHEEIIEKINELIVQGGFKVGDKIPSLSYLSNAFGVGVPTIREALSVMSALGLMEIKHGSGAYIKALPSALDPTAGLSLNNSLELLHWYQYRRAVDVEAAGLAAENRTDDDIFLLEDIHQRIVNDLRYRGEASDFDFEFHQAIATATRNPVFVEVSANIKQKIQHFFELNYQQYKLTTSRKEGIIKEHLNVLEAIKNGDKQNAYKFMRVHLNNAEKKLR